MLSNIFWFKIQYIIVNDLNIYCNNYKYYCYNVNYSNAIFIPFKFY